MLSSQVATKNHYEGSRGPSVAAGPGVAYPLTPLDDHAAQCIPAQFFPAPLNPRSSLKAAVNQHEVAMSTKSLSPSHHALYIAYVSFVLSARQAYLPTDVTVLQTSPKLTSVGTFAIETIHVTLYAHYQFSTFRRILRHCLNLTQYRPVTTVTAFVMSWCNGISRRSYIYTRREGKQRRTNY